MKRNFLTGLAILMPIALTLWLLVFMMNILTNPFVGIAEQLLGLNLDQMSETGSALTLLVCKIGILILLAALTFAIGFFGQHLFVRSLLNYSDFLFHRIPFVNKIYMAAQEVVKTLFHEEHTDFSQVVLVPFPHETARSIGFITKRDQTPYIDANHGNKISVFVPGTPNPTMGFMLLYDREKLIFTKMSIEEAMKFVISCGVMAEGLKKGYL